MTGIIKLTDAAITRLKSLLVQKQDALGMKIGVKQGGCSGLTYTFNYCYEVGSGDEIVEIDGIKVLVDPSAVLFIIGTTLDYTDDKVRSGFVFNNPNEKGKCGCGSSFST